MRSIHTTAPQVPDRPGRSLTAAEAAIIIVIVLLAGALAAAGLPVFGVMELVGAAAYLACRTIKGLREQPPADQALADAT
ncbi:hypothetical protein ACIGZJ_34350 [Kitasatospora sp. NPDC052868]|uniref:hypothetical protein n=1 Tax=Kitasatospora sp. NPDC052868 TaxID=3364060 RepID=UPI0037CA3BD5